MAAHGFASEILVACRNCLDDLGMLAVDQPQIGGLIVFILLATKGGTRNNILADHRQKLAEAWIVGRLGNDQMQGEIGIRCRLACLETGADCVMALNYHLFLGRRSTQCCKACSLDLHCRPQFQKLDGGGDASGIDAADQKRGRGGGGGFENEDASTLSGLYQPICAQRGDCFTHNCARHAVGFRQLCFTRQFGSWWILTGADRLAQGIPELLHQRARSRVLFCLKRHALTPYRQSSTPCINSYAKFAKRPSVARGVIDRFDPTCMISSNQFCGGWRVKRLLLTGAAGGLGSAMRSRLKGMAECVRVSDIVDLGQLATHEEGVICDLGDRGAVDRLVEGCDGIIHLGGISVEDKFSKIMNANLLGLYNLYEAARANGMPRILFASSNHTIGFYRQDEYLDHEAPMRPDGLYGVSKCFGEALARMYFEKFGQETALVRIGSCMEKPRNHRMLSTWMSYDDFLSMIECIFRAPRLGCPVIWGCSNNDTRWWDNSHVSYLGWHPKDNAERFRAEIDATVPKPAPDEAIAIYQGGPFVRDPIFSET
jgi:uronate dehydrogenase